MQSAVASSRDGQVGSSETDKKELNKYRRFMAQGKTDRPREYRYTYGHRGGPGEC
jgi:hypothetical protein